LCGVPDAPLAVVRPSVPDATQLAEIRALIASVAREDGRAPLSDQALAHLASPSVEHALALRSGHIAGYAQLAGESLEIAAEPDAAAELLAGFAGRPVLVWSHGEHSRLAHLMAERRFSRRRELHQLRRPLTDPIDAPDVPDGVRLSAFRVGEDEQAWLRVNAAAFAGHPEQGRWTRADLEAREQEPWFDPAGFLLAWRGAELVGFHWTKVHPDGAGEVYVIGVAPAAQGLGLGAVLLLHGLAALRRRGCLEVLLYVDGSNTGAMRLYAQNGFRPHDVDVQWSAHASTGSVSNT
jgi:mycothiol synthase